MAMNATRIRRNGSHARSRTPSPMYLELNNGGGGSSKDFASKDFAHQEFLNFDPVSSSEHEGSGSHTPRENPFGIHGIFNPDKANRELPWHLPGDRDREVKQRQLPTEAVLPARERVWSTTTGTAPRPGYGCEFRDSPAEMNVPLPRHGNAPYGSQGIPGFDLGQSLRNYSNGSGGAYAGYPAYDTEAQAAPHPTSAFGFQIGNEQVPMPPIPPQSFSDRKPRIMPPPPGMPTGFCDLVPSIGSRGHPHNCEKGCKYIWKKRGCHDGANCPRCHLCRPNKAQTLSIPQPPAATNVPSRTKPMLSVGSLGHPHSCAAACKYNGRKAGCKDGRLCDRCHVCRWTRTTERPKEPMSEPWSGSVGTEAKAMRPPSKFKEMSTQTTVDVSTQCDRSEEDDNSSDEEPAAAEAGTSTIKFGQIVHESFSV